MLQKRLRVVYTFLAVGLALLMIGTPLLTQAARGEITQTAANQLQNNAPTNHITSTHSQDFDTAGNWRSVDGLAMTSYGTKAYTDTVRPDDVSYYAEATLRESTGTQDGFSRTRSGAYAWRLRDSTSPFWQARISDGGVENFSVWVRRWDSTPDPNYVVEYSTDSGSNWTALLTINNAWLDNSSDWKEVTGSINASNAAGDIIIQIRRVSGERLMIDDFTMSTYDGEITLTKTVTPTTNVMYHGTVTYTVVLDNSMTVSDTVLFTDTLPTEVTFGAWIEQPAGAVESGNEITWSGTLTASTALTFTFTATHVGDYGDIITNTAEFSGTTQAGTAEAAFTVEKDAVDVTFMYHDLEGVVQTGETVWIAGTFNSWTAAQMGDAGGGVYTYTVAALNVDDTYSYKYIVNDGSDRWDWLNTDNRFYTVVDEPEHHDYRNVTVGYANLDGPATLNVNTFEATAPVAGQVYINNVTNPAGAGRGVKAEVGYGDSADPAMWEWFPMAFNAQIGNNDQFTGVMTPTQGGIFSYTVRFDGNWGVGNPNAAWTYSDLTGVGPYPGGEFSLADTGVLTSTIYDIAVLKTALMDEIAVYSGEETPVAYVIEIENQSTLTTVNTIALMDVLPIGFIYAGDNSGVAPTVISNTLNWEFTNLAAGDSLSFTLILSATDSITMSGMAINAVAIAVEPVDMDVTNNTDIAEVMVHRIYTIAEARTFTNTTQVTIEGIVTAEPGIFKDSGTNRKLYIEDETGGMLIYLFGGLNPVARHHRVRVTGALAEYRAERELVPTSAAAVVDLGLDTPIVPQVLANNEVTEDVEGQLVQIAGYVTAKPFSYILRVNDGTGEVDINRYINLGQTGDPNYIDFTQYAVGDYVIVTGVSRGYDYSGTVRREVLPRGPADITEQYPLTFIYHDLEDVIPDGETLYAVGNFNGWSNTATPLAGANGIYSASLILDVTAPYTLDYKLVIGNNWNDGRGDLLNTSNRSATITGPTTLHLYRNIRSGYAKLNGPAAITVNLGETTPAINGEAWFSNIPFGANQVLHAQIGYGTDANPVNWTWVAAAFSGRNGNNDVFTATLTPIAAGTYSYTIRFDGNWGSGNPNTFWYLGDLTGVHPGNPFNISNVGVLTVTAPDLSIAKSVTPDSDLNLGDVVTYTIILDNAGDGMADDILITDTLPSGVTFGGWAMGHNASGAVYANGVITWAGDMPAGVQPLAIVFTATVDMDTDLYGQTITNTVEYASANAGEDSDSAAFTVFEPAFTLTVNIAGQGEVTRVPSQTTYTYGQVVTLTAAADLGWVFDSWDGDASGSQLQTSVTMNTDKVVTATFTAIPTFTLTMAVEGNGTVAPAVGDHVYNEGTVVAITATAATGWEFTGWLGDVADPNAANTTVTMDADQVVTATFEAIPYTLTIHIAGQGDVTRVPSQTTYIYGQQVTLTPVPAANWLFANWSGDASGTDNPLDITIEGNTVITAHFALDCVPVADVNFTWAPTHPLVGELVTFNASVGAGTAPLTYIWNFGHGADEPGNSSIGHTFPLTSTAVTYDVTLTVINACTPAGEEVTHSITIHPRRIFLPLVLRNFGTP